MHVVRDLPMLVKTAASRRKAIATISIERVLKDLLLILHCLPTLLLKELEHHLPTLP